LPAAAPIAAPAPAPIKPPDTARSPASYPHAESVNPPIATAQYIRFLNDILLFDIFLSPGSGCRMTTAPDQDCSAAHAQAALR
jgi:hypothetical protein